jgi:heat shock protein HtpX
MTKLKTTVYLLFVTLLALWLNLTLALSSLNMGYFLSLINIDIDRFVTFIILIAIIGAFASLVFSVIIARFSLNVTLITQASSYLEKWLLMSVARQSRQLGIAVPQIGIFSAANLNAFTSGWGSSSAMFAISSGLLESLDEQELDAVIGHELAHIESGDMISLALSQGLVVCLTELPARLFGYVFDHLIFRHNRPGGFFYTCVYWFCMLLMGLLPHFIVMWFSRQREFSADKTSAFLNGVENIVSALRHLSLNRTHSLSSKRITALGMSGIGLEGLVGGMSSLKDVFSSHPPLNIRIHTLENENV